MTGNQDADIVYSWKSGRTKSGQARPTCCLPHATSSVLRRKLHPVLAAMGQPKCGVHAFRHFRNTYLRNFTSTPPGVLQFWMGQAGEGMSDLHDKIKSNVAFRKEMAEKAVWASNFRPKSSLLDGMDGNSNLRAIWE
jgi:integrase